MASETIRRAFRRKETKLTDLPTIKVEFVYKNEFYLDLASIGKLCGLEPHSPKLLKLAHNFTEKNIVRFLNVNTGFRGSKLCDLFYDNDYKKVLIYQPVEIAECQFTITVK